MDSIQKELNRTNLPKETKTDEKCKTEANEGN
jgi:hypothetical protein